MSIVAIRNPRLHRRRSRRQVLHKGHTMDVTLHIGAHRCATTSFQFYMRNNHDALRAQGVGVWGPARTRSGLFHGVADGHRIRPAFVRQMRAIGRVQLNLAREKAAGTRHLIVSDENMMGTMMLNLRDRALYPGAGLRMAHFADAFDGYLTDVVINTRSPDLHWASMLAYCVTRGQPVPDRRRIAQIAAARRSWRDVVTDVAAAAPGARLTVAPFETFGGRPEVQLELMTGRKAPRRFHRKWHHRSPGAAAIREAVLPAQRGLLPETDGRWQPFSAAQAAHLRETYADDLMWLAAGADGLARLAEDPQKKQAEQTLPPPEMTRGKHDDDDRRLAGAG